MNTKAKRLSTWLVTLLVVLVGCIALFALFLLFQLVPYGKNHANPLVVAEPNWDSPRTRELAQRACFDCHSNETTWPWYSSVAPMSWLVQRDVDEGRQHLNFSDWGRVNSRRLRELNEVILEGSMPPLQYTILHPNASLSAAEKQELSDGLSATVRR
jgi:hypothetical protein